MFGLNPIAQLRKRLGAVVGAFALAAGCCGCGAFMTFVAAPSQALEAVRVARLPVLDAGGVAAAPAGQTVLIAGVLAGNAPAGPAGSAQAASFVAYSVEEWQVTVPSSDDAGTSASPQGKWQALQTVVPALTLAVGGRPVAIEAASGAQLSGALREVIVPSASGSEATFDGQPLRAGSRRYEGLNDGDAASVLGTKAAGGGVAPQKVFAGERAAFVESEREAASNLFIGGIGLMVMAPVVLVGGVLAALFWRRR